MDVLLSTLVFSLKERKKVKFFVQRYKKKKQSGLWEAHKVRGSVDMNEKVVSAAVVIQASFLYIINISVRSNFILSKGFDKCVE